MKGVTELVLSICDLAEAEGRLFKSNAVEVVRLCALLIIGFGFGAAAICFFLASAYYALINVLPRPLVLSMAGAACILTCAAFLWSARGWKKKNRSRQTPKKN